MYTQILTHVKQKAQIPAVKSAVGAIEGRGYNGSCGKAGGKSAIDCKNTISKRKFSSSQRSRNTSHSKQIFANGPKKNMGGKGVTSLSYLTVYFSEAITKVEQDLELSMPSKN